MAAAAASLQDFCEEALCSICLEYLKDPVILIECGHNFCRACLTRYWEGSEGGEVSCCCPQCRRKVQRNLIPNRQLANFVDLTRKLRLQEENSAEGKGGVCGEHQEPLKLFCKEDEIPLCVVCKWLQQHQDHQVVPLEEAAQEYKNLISSHLGRLEKERAEIIASKIQGDDDCQLFLVSLKQTKAKVEKTRDKLRKPHSFFNKQNKLLLAQNNLKLARLEEVEEDIARNRDKDLARLSEEFSSLGSLVQEMEEKHQQPPEELLQDVREILQRPGTLPPSEVLHKGILPWIKWVEKRITGLWNSLPEDVTAVSLDSFKKGLDKFMENKGIKGNHDGCLRTTSGLEP